MKTELLVFKKVIRDKFLYEDFIPNDHILGIVKAGSFLFDDGSGETEVSENECILFQKGVRYLRRVTRPLEMFLFRFTIDVNIFTSSKLALHSSDWLASSVSYLDELYSGLYAEELFCQHAILDSILSLYIMADARKKQECIPQDAAVDRFLRIIHSDIQTKLNLPAIAQELGMSYVQLLRRFEAAVGVTPSEYIINFRLKTAREHLLNTAQPIKSIALACGYQDAYYFSNAFKKRYGVSPTAFRKRDPEAADETV